MDVMLDFKKSKEISFTANIKETIIQIIGFVLDSETAKEIDIKASYVFFGIMKALKINIKNLNFKEIKN